MAVNLQSSFAVSHLENNVLLYTIYSLHIEVPNHADFLNAQEMFAICKMCKFLYQVFEQHALALPLRIFRMVQATPVTANSIDAIIGIMETQKGKLVAQSALQQKKAEWEHWFRKPDAKKTFAVHPADYIATCPPQEQERVQAKILNRVVYTFKQEKNLENIIHYSSEFTIGDQMFDHFSTFDEYRTRSTFQLNFITSQFD